jgi:DNA polymerase III alpha subunit
MICCSSGSFRKSAAKPMGFYAPAQIVRDARDHGVEVRPVCVNASRWDCTLEPTDDESRFAVRLGMRMVKGLPNTDAATIVGARVEQPFLSVDDLWRRAGVPAGSLVRLAEADAFQPSSATMSLAGRSMDMIFQGMSMSLFQAKQQWSRMSS